jgi:hypothetical protein
LLFDGCSILLSDCDMKELEIVPGQEHVIRVHMIR